MERIIKEYNSWLKENQNFILHLEKHDSSLYSRLMPIYKVLNFLCSETTENGLELDGDLEKIFQVGLEYLHTQVSTCKIYYEKIFNKNFHDFIEYDSIVNYVLFLEDLRYELEENQVKLNEKIINDLMDYLENIMELKSGIPENFNLFVDSEIHKIVDLENFSFHSIIDIFVEIAETLGIDLYSETEFMIGKDI